MRAELLKLALPETYRDGRELVLSPIRFHAQRLSQFLSAYFTHYYLDDDDIPALFQSLDTRLAKLRVHAGAISELTLMAEKLIQRDSSEIIKLLNEKRLQLKLWVTDEMHESMVSIVEEFLSDFEASGAGYGQTKADLNEHFRQSVVFPALSGNDDFKNMAIPLAEIRDKLFLSWSHDEFMGYLKLVDELMSLPAYATFRNVALEKYGSLVLSAYELEGLREEIEVLSLWETHTKEG